jgi:hypothetical protein
MVPSTGLEAAISSFTTYSISNILRSWDPEGDTYTHRTAVIVNKARTHFVKYQTGYILAPQLEPEPWEISVHLEKGN